MRPFCAQPRCRRLGVGGDRGMALLVTLAIITVLVTAGLELNRRMRATVHAAAAARDRFAAEQVAVSGIHAAMALLIKDKLETRADSIQEDWASPEKLQEALLEIPFEEGRVALEITDERARIQLNALVTHPGGQQFNPEQEMLLDRFLRPIIGEFEVLESKDPVFEELNLTATIINSLKDWIDSGDDDATTGLSGAESDYYESLDPPYRARNAPLADLAELLRIKGVSPDLFYGREGLPGIAGFLTVHGSPATAQSRIGYDGKININTAELPVLRALLPAEYAELAQAIVDYRLQADNEMFLHDLSLADWYQSVPGLAGIALAPQLITVASDHFRIRSTGALREVEAAVTAVVRREKNPTTGRWHCKVLSWRKN
ncbi:MAG: type II secretion system minor pseudopilin GspK [Desulfobacterales bacterium]